MTDDIMKIKQADLSLRDKLRAKFSGVPFSKALLMDISGSMMGGPIERLREIAEDFKGVRRFTFSDYCKEVPMRDKIGGADGGTNMAGAFCSIKDAGILHCVLITDGQPNDKKSALHDARGLKIDIIYVGPEPRPKFLDDLAASTGGTTESVSLQSLAIEGKITKLLGMPKGAIEL